MTQDMNHTITKVLKAMLVVTMMSLTGSHALAQVKVNGSVFGGGNEADVQVNTEVNITSSTCEISGNVYGGGNVGSVGKYTTSEDMKTFTFTENTGICNVTIDGGTIGTGVERSSDGTFADGNVYGAGKGEADTYWCEKAMVYKTNVAINAGTIRGTVYGGGQIGRVEDDATVTIGAASPANNTVTPTIAGNVFGAGAGLQTHGYSALLRGDTKVTVQGYAQVGLSVYGGGEKASVGRFKIVDGLPSEPQDGGTCEVTVKGNANIGTSGIEHNVFGSCQGVAAPTSLTAYNHAYKSMQAKAQKVPDPATKNTAWEWIEGSIEGSEEYYWEYYADAAAYKGFLNTLALASHTDVEIGESASVYGSVFGGGQMGITLGNVALDIKGGTVYDDVYGGGALADTNKGNLTAVKYDVATVTVGETVVTGMYERSGDSNNYEYTLIEEPDTKAATGKTYCTRASQSSINTTIVNLTGGLIMGDAYGGGLGQKTGFNSASSDIAAVVYGDISVNLGSSGGSSATAFNVTQYTEGAYAGIVKSGRVFGCNNLMGSPQGDVRVTVYKTVADNISRTTSDAITNNKALKEAHPETYENEEGYVTPTYEVAAIYGGGNLADYTTAGKKAYVRIETCDVSIRDVYGGGNAAEVPETDVLVRGAHEIQEVFGGGNGKDPFNNGTEWINNPGANIGNATNPGNATTLLTGGFIHEAYGGSNKKGTIFGSVSIDMGVGSSAEHTNGACTLDVEKLVGAGKNADVNGDLIMIMGCKPSTKTPLLFAGADNANVKGNVELTITSGNFGKVFGGNNEGGAIFGHIKLNIEETGGCDTPITIDELYLGGNMAAYSQYGYYNNRTAEDPEYQPRTSASDTHTAVYFGDNSSNDHTKAPYAQPELNVISCTYIGKVFGGGYGTGATLYGDPIVNLNMIQGNHYNDNSYGVPAKMTELHIPSTDNPNKLGIIGDVFGGGNAADVIGNTTVNIGMATTVTMTSVDDDPSTTDVDEKHPNVLGAYITGNVFGGGNEANVSGNTYVNICGTQESDSESENGYTDTAVSHSETTDFAISIGNSVYGGGNAADVLGNTFVTFANGYVFNGIFGGGLAGSVGTYERSTNVTDWGHTANHAGCIGKPTECTAGGTCYVVVSGGQIGPVTVATKGMNRLDVDGGPVPQGWVWGGGCGIVEDPATHPDTHFKAYVNHTDVTIKDNAFILESIIGGGEFGRVLGNTLVKIKGGQIGVGERMVDNDGKPIRYTDAQFIDPTDSSTPITESNALAACSHFKFEAPYNTYDPYADSYKAAMGSDKYPGGSTDGASDGKTWIGCVFAGGSGYMPVVKATDANDKVTDYEWISSAGWVEGNAVLRISGGHILSNVYGGNEITSVKGKTTVTMTGGTIGVPRTRAQVLANPMIGNLFGAGKGDPRSYFDTFTNVQEVEVNVSGGIVYGSVYGGSEDGHVLGDAAVNISGGAKIGTWGASYIDGNVYGGGMGSTENVVAGIIKGNTTVTIENSTVGENTVSPTILHNVYGGGAYGSVGTFTYDANNVITAHTANTGTANVTITGGTIGTNGHENGMVFGSSRGDVGRPGEIHDRLAWVYDTHVTIGTSGQGTTLTTPLIKGSIYGSGENGHTYNDAEVIIHSGTIGITDTSIDDGAAYLYRGNVYGGGCGTDMYDSNNDDVKDTYNPLAGVVYGDAMVTIDGGQVVHNVYGAGAMGSVGKATTTNNVTTITGGTTTINISGGMIGVSGTVGDGNVFGAARGSVDATSNEYALVRKITGVNISGSALVKGNVYGGGELGCVGTYSITDGMRTFTWQDTDGTTNTADNAKNTGVTNVTITGGTIGTGVDISAEGSYANGNVFGAGKGKEDTFWCEKGIVYKANVNVTAGTVKGNVYGGGEVGRVETDATVKIGPDTETASPNIFGNVFGGGAGLKTHGYAALVRGNTYVTVQSSAQVGHNVYGGGQIAAVGKYYLNTAGMPYSLVDDGLGICNVTVKGDAAITGSVFGGGKGKDPETFDFAKPSGSDYHTSSYNIDTHMPKRMMNYYDDHNTYWEYFGSSTNGIIWEYFDTKVKYETFLETLGLTTQSRVTIGGIRNENGTVTSSGSPTVNGNVYGGSESGFVQHNTLVTIAGGTVGTTTTGGNVFGGGLGLATFAEAGRVRGNATVTINAGTVNGNVYGGGQLGDVGTIVKRADYNYKWTNAVPSSIDLDDSSTYPYNSTGLCTVTINGGTIGTGVTANDDGTYTKGNVYGAGKGLEDTWWCEKAMAYKTNITITDGTINGTVYGGGQVGRVENDAMVTIGTENETGTGSKPNIIGNVFGAGAGVKTHGYSALVRGNATVTVQGIAQVGKSVYGGGEIASVGKFTVVDGLPKHPDSGGTCTVTIQDNAKIGASGTGHNVFGACKGVTPAYNNTPNDPNRSKSMQLATNAPSNTSLWSYYEPDHTYIWRYYPNETAYRDFLETLALTSHPIVTIAEDATVNGSVFGGGERGITLGSVDVNMNGGTVTEDVYGGGSLANTNKGNWDDDKYVATTPAEGTSVNGLYSKSGETYTEITDATATANGSTTYYIKGAWADGKTSADYTTTVNLKGGMIKGDAYGGGLGQLGNDPIEAKVYGDVFVNQGTANVDGAPATAYTITYLTDNSVEGKSLQVVNSGRIFGCNNLNGSPKGNVTVTVNRTVTGKDGNGNNITRTTIGRDGTTHEVTSVATPHTYEVAAVYGGGNLADYTPENGNVKVRISSCDVSIEEVYGGGNAAMVPGTDVLVTGAHEIEHVFGGGNGEDKYYLNGQWNDNPGANVNGNANTLLKGGLIHEAYGGSNEKGTITGDITIDTGTGGLAGCPVKVDKLVGAGKNADVNGNLIIVLGCYPTTKTPLIFAGADNANVNGDVELTITSGTFGQVFGGNNEGGAIRGHIKLNIEETGCNPIIIDELYLGGNDAAYSRYGYYVKTNETEAENGNGVGDSGETAILTNEKLTFIPRTSATDKHLPVKTYEKNGDTWTWTTDAITGSAAFKPYEQPELNVTSCTSIGEVFGGGYGVGGKMYADPTVNINMIPGEHAQAQLGGADKLGAIGKVYGGGNAANVYGDATVNIGTAETVLIHKSYDKVTKKYTTESKTVTGANITGNIYGGGKKADVGQYDVDNDRVDVAGNTYVNIGAKYNTTSEKWESVAEGTSKVLIAGNVFGGGEGEAAESGAGAFKCAKAIVTGETNIHIGNGTINGTVYGGGEVGRVEGNSVVAIGIGEGSTSATSAPEIKGDVFGAGKGKKTHGYSALLRGNPTVTIEGDAKVRGSVYGGGEIASVGKYNVKKGKNNPEGAPDDVLVGMPYSLANSGSGYCTVIIQGNAEIGPATEMKMKTTSGIPDDTGHVIGGGKGVLPYDGYGVTNDDWVGDPWRVSINDEKDIFNSTTYPSNYEKEYFKYIETLALATETNVTISGNAFVKGSVYGGSLNGHVQHDTHVTIAGGQIGQGEGQPGRYSAGDWDSESLAECPHWDYVASSGAPYDPFATASGTYDYGNYGFVPSTDRIADSKGGLPEAKDGHTYYGNVFGGGSGVIPYAPGKWHRGAGSVGGDTYVNITGGHILTSVYGGNEHTDVGTYTKDENGQPTTTPAASNARGKCTVNMTGGTVGVPRKDKDKQDHPVVGNVFGAGKGDQRIFFNTWTNVINTEVNISGNARIYGSVFGGGEDGHIIGDAETNIGGTVTIGTTNYTHPTEISATNPGVIIGTTGTSYMDGNVFGGGRGFSGDAQTAGTVGGNVEVNIENGKILGSVYGGGRLASVGTMFEFPTLSTGEPNPAYGQFKEDETGANAKTYGHVTINISGGTIGNENATGDGAKYSGNVFGGSMGRLTLLNGDTNPIWPKMAQVKETNVNIYGTAVVRRSVYGGGELGTVRDNAYVTIGGQKTVDADDDGKVTVTTSGSPTVRRDVYGGGYGSEDRNYTIFTIPELISTNPDTYESHTYAFTPMQFAGCVGKNTYVNVVGGYISKSVYGGGELASVGVINFRAEEVDNSTVTPTNVVVSEGTSKSYIYSNMVKHAPVKVDNKDVYYGFGLSWPYEFEYVDGYPGATHVKVTGGRLGLKTGDTDTGFDDNGDVYGAGKGKAGDYKDYLFCANVGSTDVVIDHSSSNSLTAYSGTADLIAGAVYGGGEDGHVMGDTKVTMKSGFVYHSIYGGGSGKGKFDINQLKIGVDPSNATENDYYPRKIYSITAGKVFGNTEVLMSGGMVFRNVYGGGNMGSVGKGNYSGGSDDYSEAGYGELPPQDNQVLWTSSTTGDNPTNPDFPWHFMHSGKCKVTITGGTVGYLGTSDFAQNMYPLKNNNRYDASLPYGNVFGGCRGESAPNITESPRYLYCPEFFVGYANETEVTIGKTDGSAGPTIKGSVYGGGMDGHVRRDASVTIYAGEIGETYDATKYDANYWMALGNVYGAGSGIGKYRYDFNYDNKIDDTVEGITYHGNSIKEEDFSTSAGSVTRFTKVEIKGGTIHRNVYGGGSLSTVGAPKIPVNNVMPPDLYRKGDTAEGHGEGKQTLNEVIIAGGHIGDASSYDANGNHKYGGHVYGGSRGSTDLDNSFSTAFYTAVNIIGDADIKGDVYGGGEAGTVKGDVDVNIAGGTIGHDVYGGGALADTQTSNWNATANENAGDWANTDQKSALYQTKVNILGGTISGDAYGGGLGRQETGTNNQPGYIAPVEAKVYGDVYVNLNGFDKREVTYDAVTHGATGDANGARLVLENNEYLVKDEVKGAVVSRIFGCNNLNGSPQGNTKVHVFKTQHASQTRITNAGDVNEAKKIGRYDLEAVYGGGNMAAYEPKDLTNGKTQVIIDGCDRTSINQVYGGGNAASTPATDVEVLGTYEIFELFGGGNGADDLPDGSPNPGANVGYKDYHLVENNPEFATKEARVDGTAFAAYRYGTGVATVDIKGGTIHRVFGGSNTKGNVRQTALTLLEEESGCPFCVDEAYGGGKSAPMDAEAQLHMACIPGLKEAYGGAEAADIQSDVTLNITNGTFNRVFGGNNISGTIRGSITVNIEETGCKPIIIGELYGGGNQAGYSIYGYKEVTEGTNKVWKPRQPEDGLESGLSSAYRDPVVNVKSFTSIGNVYGGGYGSSAEMVGSPTVNINVTEEATSDAQNYTVKVDDDNNEATPEVDVFVSDYAGGSVKIDEGLPTERTVTLPSHEKGKMGAINNVFGGGNAAKVIGNTYVNIGTENEVIFETPTKKTVTTTVNNEEVTTEEPTTESERTKTVKGADIRGNVYGGGNAAEVTGNTNVVIGKEKTTTTTTTP